MGYTHYWDHPKYKSEICREAIKRCNEVIQDQAHLLGDGFGLGEVSIKEKCIHFNGKQGNGCETFVIKNRKTDFDFCKTRRKPYDVVVVACLLILYHLLPGFSVRSDGKDIDWFRGLELAKRVTGLPLTIPHEIEKTLIEEVTFG